MNQDLYALKAVRNDGGELDFGEYRDKLLLIVNTASKCGFTPQYKGLESLHAKYSDRGLRVLGFPCDQFAHQEPGSDEEIARFCQRNFGVTFPLMSKVRVNGPDTHPVFAWLKLKAPGLLGGKIRWNFTKFLVAPGAARVLRFAPSVEPSALEAEIERALPG